MPAFNFCIPSRTVRPTLRAPSAIACPVFFESSRTVSRAERVPFAIACPASRDLSATVCPTVVAPWATACPAVRASSLTVAVESEGGALQTGATASARMSETAAAAAMKLALMTNYRTTAAPVFAPRAPSAPSRTADCAGVAVPITEPFGHTSPDASRPSPNLRAADPLCAGWLGPARLRAGVLPFRLHGTGGARIDRLPRASRGDADIACPLCTRRLRGPYGAAHADRHAGIARVHLYLRDARRQEPPRGSDPDPVARLSPVRADPELLGDYSVLSSAHARAGGRCGNGRHLPHLHQPGVEHGVQLLPLPAQHPGRAGGGGTQFPARPLDAVLAARGAFRHAFAHLEHDDVHVGRLVLRHGVRSHQRRQHDGDAAGGRVLHCARHRAEEH